MDWKYHDWMGWHEQGDGKWFLGVNIEQGRVKDFGARAVNDPELDQSSDVGAASGAKIKSALRKIVDELSLTHILTPSQSIIFKDVLPEQKARLNQILADHGITPIEKVDPLVRLSIACPALPLCGLAVAEAERRMPEWMANMRKLMNKLGLEKEEILMRMTGCPNGCARPYMAELALVGDGPEMYQVWLGGSPVLTRLAQTYSNKVKWEGMDAYLEPLLVYWRDSRQKGEAFGDFVSRVGLDSVKSFQASYGAPSV